MCDVSDETRNMDFEEESNINFQYNFNKSLSVLIVLPHNLSHLLYLSFLWLSLVERKKNTNSVLHNVAGACMWSHLYYMQSDLICLLYRVQYSQHWKKKKKIEIHITNFNVIYSFFYVQNLFCWCYVSQNWS